MPIQPDFTKITLENGLTVLLKEIHTAPIISHWLWYRVGSRDETPGITGASHWVEHMLFKGTPKHPGGVLDKSVSREGGFWNAMTYIDWTTYFATMPADKIDLIQRLEADRINNCMFPEDDVASERTVILSERQGSENSPLFQLDEAVQSAAFNVHAYKHEVIGSQADLESMQRDDLYQHYKHYYVPNNAVLALAGDFDTKTMLARIRELMEPIPSGKTPQRPTAPEPPQEEERRVEVEGPDETAFVRAAYHAPNTNDPEFFAFTVLDSLLTGPTSLNLFGGGISNKTSHLYQALVDEEIAVGVGGGLHATIDPYLYNITMTVHPDRSPEDVVARLDAEIDRVQQNLPDADQLARAVKQARALFAYGTESITNQAFWLGFAEMYSSYDWFLTYIDRLAAVTPEDVQQTAQKYLATTNRVLGIYRPTGNGAAHG